MKILIINSVCGIGSTGRICTDLATEYEKSGDTVKIAYGRDGFVPEQFRRFAVRIGTDKDVKLHALKTRLTDRQGLGSVRATKRFLQWAEEYNPDLLYMHNLHGYYINYELLFRWIKTHPQMKVIWALHDCWAITGHCVHFAIAECNQWKTHCLHCPQTNQYPAAFRDGCYKNYERKKAAFTGVPNMELILASEWIAGFIKQSFLKEYPIRIEDNKVNTDVFCPTPSNFRRENGLENQVMILGVANNWTEKKRLGDFLRLAELLDEHYRIVLVGLTEPQLKTLPERILGITRTNNAKELAALYTAADVYVNASREETFGMTTLEARSCGTNAIVYKGTACEEVVAKYGGIAVEPTVSAIYEAIVNQRYLPQEQAKEEQKTNE